MINDLTKALKEAGYTLDGFTRLGDRLTIRLTPAADFQALETCAAMGLQADCRVFAAVPQDLLILSVKLPKAQHPTPKPTHPRKSKIGNRKSEIK